MKRQLILLSLTVPLLATKCAQKAVNFNVRNLSESDIAMTSAHELGLVAKLATRDTFFQGQINIIRKRENPQFDFPESDLNYYISRQKDFYTFYFFRLNSLGGRPHFAKNYDSINIPVDDIKIGVTYRNILHYKTGAIDFIKE